MFESKPLLLTFLLILLSTPVWNQSQPNAAGASQSPPATTGTQEPQATGSGTATSQPGQKPEPVYESSAVLKAVTRLVIADVVATDKKGEPIKDLKLSDFSIMEDGKEQSIKVFNFQQPQLYGASSSMPAIKPSSLPANIYTNEPTFHAASALNVVLLDALNTTMPNQAYVRDQMIHYLERMPENSPVAVYMLGTKLRLLQDFTTDPALLKDVVHKLKSGVSPLLSNPTGGPDQEILPPGVADSGVLSASMLDVIMSFEREQTAMQTDLRIGYTLNAMNVLARQLAGYPGRKNLVWLSEAFPINIDPSVELTNPFAGTRNYGPQIADAAQAMIDAQIAVYPVDARGLVSSSYFNASNNGRDQFGRSLSRGGTMSSALSNESANLANVHSTMQDLAERTGGKAFYNRNDIDGALRNSIDDGSTYYTLGYYPQNKNWDGKFRKIHVKVDRPGVKLRYRIGYYAIDPKALSANKEKLQAAEFSDALSLETPVATALKFHAGVIAPSVATQNKVFVNFGADSHAISFEEDNAGLQHARVECAITAFNSKGKFVKSTSSTVNAGLKPDTFRKVMQGYFPCQQSIDLPEGNYLLRLGMRDLNTGLMGTANAKVAVSAVTAEAAPASGDQKKP